MKKSVRQLALILGLLTVSSMAFGDPVRWYLQGVTLSDGAHAMGSFVYDIDTDQYSEVDIVTSIGEASAGSSYADPNPDSPGNQFGLLVVKDGSADPLTGQPVFTIEYSAPLSNAGGTVTVKIDGFSYEGQCAMGSGGDTRECGVISVDRTFAAGSITSIKPGAFISAGFNGAWAYAATPGQGVLLDVYPAIPLVFLAWFTYDVTQAPPGSTAQVGDPNHRWLTAQGVFRANEAVLDLFLTTGGIFDDPTQVTNSAANSYGRIVLTFANDCRSATFEYQLFEQNRQGSFPLRRLADDNVNMCLQLAQSAAGPGATGRIYYQFRRTYIFSDIHSVNPDGSDDIALTDDGGSHEDPAPSPDGTKVAFVADNVVQLMNADGSDRRALAAGRFPDFSPDGQQIVYSNNGIHIMDLEGNLFDSPRDSGDMPDWSPDGAQIVFREGEDIWVMNAAGNAAVNLTQSAATASSHTPRWSPDGGTIAYYRCEGAFCHIVLMDSLGKNVRNLTNGEVADALPDWSPDGEWISFTRSSEKDGPVEIWKARRDGSVISKVTDNGKASTAKWGKSPE